MKKILILALITLSMYSCKKEENKSSSMGTPTVLASNLVGKWVHTDADTYTVDTIYVYESSGSYYITAPQIGSYTNDTLGINVTGDTFTIPAQIIYSTVSLEGDGNLVLSNQLNLNWTTSPPSNTVYNDVIYIRQ